MGYQQLSGEGPARPRVTSQRRVLCANCGGHSSRAYEYFSSSAAKNALKSRKKSASRSFTLSPTLSLSTDFSGGCLSDHRRTWATLGVSRPAPSRWLSKIELHKSRTSFNGLSSLPWGRRGPGGKVAYGYWTFETGYSLVERLLSRAS